MTETNVTPTNPSPSPSPSLVRSFLYHFPWEKRSENQHTRNLASSDWLDLCTVFFSSSDFCHRWSTYLLGLGWPPPLSRLPSAYLTSPLVVFLGLVVEQRRGVRSWTERGKPMWIADLGDFVLFGESPVERLCYLGVGFLFRSRTKEVYPISHLPPPLCLVSFLFLGEGMR